MTRSAFAAWAAGIRASFFTGRVRDLHGWARRSPILAVALVAIAVATVGFPGLAAFDARASLIDLTLDGPLSLPIRVAVLLPVLYYARLLAGRPGRPATCRRTGRTVAATGQLATIRRDRRRLVATWAQSRLHHGLDGGRPGLLALLTASGGLGVPAAALDTRRRGGPAESAFGRRAGALPDCPRRSSRGQRAERGPTGRTSPVDAGRPDVDAVGQDARQPEHDASRPGQRTSRRLRRRASRPRPRGAVVRGERDARPLRADGPRGVTRRSEDPAIDVALVVEQLVGSNHSASSAAAASGLSEAWTMFWAVSSAKSPRIVPGAASCGRVAPLIARTTAMAFGPSSARATSGDDMMNSTSPAKNGFSRCAGVVPLGEVAIDMDELEPGDLQAARLIAREDATDELALDAVGLDEDEGSFAG